MPIKVSLAILLLPLLLLACEKIEPQQPQQAELVVTAVPVTASPNFTQDVKPILDKRCVVCHACYDAPCQLKLGSPEGIQRGASKAQVYDGERLVADNLTRLFEDAHSTEQWREKGFFSVLGNTNTAASEGVLASMLKQKQANKWSGEKLLDESFNLDINSKRQCVNQSEYSDYADKNPLQGMPYGLPAISADNHQVLINWLVNGAEFDVKQSLDEATIGWINKWETFLNQPSNKGKLVSRYLYEHLFIAHLYFESQGKPQFFKLVRSKTPMGEEIEVIATRRPFDDPEVSEVYYRLVEEKQTIVDKLHLPLKLNDARMKRWQQLFFEPNYQVNTIPSYKAAEASNPFITFEQLPMKSRYRFLIEESQYQIMQFIKGPVCRGQIALNVINDHFWVVFTDPELSTTEQEAEFMRKARRHIALPAEAKSNALPTNWLAYAKMEREYLRKKSDHLQQRLADRDELNLDLIWDGDGNNDNAALTIFRHSDAASVVKGLVGNNPQTVWVLTYPLFERIHYLLVAGYDVYGNVGHQLNSRMYMDFLRMEGEFNFLAFLPSNSRKQVREKWYRGSVSAVEKFVYDGNHFDAKTAIDYKTQAPFSELLEMLKAHLHKPLSGFHSTMPDTFNKDAVRSLLQINDISGIPASLMPQSSIVQVIDIESGKDHFFTLLSNSAYTNISHMFSEQERRLPKEDTLTLGYGFMTSHPNAFWRISTDQLAMFNKQLINLRNEEQYLTLVDKYGVRRTDPDFWQYADNMHAYYAKTQPLKSGLLDFNRLENQ